jgi:hypothetical protein
MINIKFWKFICGVLEGRPQTDLREIGRMQREYAFDPAESTSRLSTAQFFRLAVFSSIVSLQKPLEGQVR